MKKGQHLTAEQIENRKKNPKVLAHLRRLSNLKIGKHISEKHRIILRNSLTGRIKTEEEKNKLSKALRGRKAPWVSRRKGNPAPWMSGSRNGRWLGGITEINQKVRNSLEYKLWRQAVFERDDYTCVWCGKRGGDHHADHIQLFSTHPELRFAIDNGRTLCIPCHKKRHQK